MVLDKPWDSSSTKKCSLDFLVRSVNYFLQCLTSHQHREFRIFFSEGRWQNTKVRSSGLTMTAEGTVPLQMNTCQVPNPGQRVCVPRALCHILPARSSASLQPPPSHFICLQLYQLQKNRSQILISFLLVWIQSYSFKFSVFILGLHSSKCCPLGPNLGFLSCLDGFESNFSKQSLAPCRLNLRHSLNFRSFIVMSGKWLQNFVIDVTMLVKVLM